MELLNNLGINGKLLLAQMINFLILLWVLHKFAYGPVVKMLEERTKKIEKGLKDAQQSQKKLEEISEKEKAVLTEARKQAQEIIKKSESTAAAQAQEIITASKDQAQKMLEMAQKQIDQEKNKILAEVKSEVATLVMMATEKIIDEKLDSVKDAQLIKEAIK
jgi:F-type H+-transporting ATPase subunit b